VTGSEELVDGQRTPQRPEQVDRSGPDVPVERGGPEVRVDRLNLPDLPDGSVRPVVRAPAAVLSAPAETVDPAEVVQLAADLVATMRVSPGCVGLAAVQIGVAARVFVADVTGHPKARTCHGLIVLCNADVVSASQWKVGREGCMSVPDLTGDVRRAGKVTVVGQAVGSGERIEVATDAFEARALQHEVDHCGGMLFLDRVVGAHAVHQRQVYL
jgi:peptide deformylase